MSDDLGSATAPAKETTRRRASWRLWAALAVGLGLVPVMGWLTAFLLTAPLGLFFVILASLLMGAVMYRVAAPAAPVPRPRLYLLGSAVGIAVWLAMLRAEYQSLPPLASTRVIQSFKTALPASQKQQIRDQVWEHIRSRLKSTYPPGGPIGYVRWVATSGRMDLPRVIDSSTVRFEMPRHSGWWITHTVFALLFIVGGLLSQVLSLAPPRVPPDEPPPTADQPSV